MIKKTEGQQEKEQVPQVAWNLAESVIEELAGLLKKASDYMVLGTLDGYDKSLHYLRAARFRIVGNLSFDDVKVFEKKEKELFIEITSARTGRLETPTLKQGRSYLKVFDLLSSYNSLLMTAFTKVGMWIPIKKKMVSLG